MATDDIKRVAEKAIQDVEAKNKPTKKSDEQILFADTTIGKFEAKPWTIAKMRKVNPCLQGVIQQLEERRISLSADNIADNILHVYFAAFDEIINILYITFEKDQDAGELEELNIADVIKMIFVVYKQNEEAIKNVLSLLQPSLTKLVND